MQNLTVKEYADIIRGRRPDLSNVEDDYLAREYLGYYPEHRDLFNREELTNLYKIKGSERGSDTQFAEFQFKEMLSNIPSAAVGGLGALTGNRDIINYSEELRAKALEDTRVRMREPELQGYLQWMEDEPITLDNMLQPQIFQRGLAQAAPSIATMLAVDVGLNLITTGLGGTALRAATGGFKAIAAAKKGKEATEAARKFVKASEKIRTAGTMASMGALEGSEQYNSTIQYLLEKGVDLEQANKIAGISGAAYGVASSILEYIPYGAFKRRLGIGSIKSRKMFEERMLNALQKQGAFKKGRTITKSMIQQAILESGTEWSQYLTSELINYYNKRGYEEVPESALKYLHKQMFTPEAVESAYSGLAMGVTMGFLPGAKTALSGKTRIAQVMSETSEDVKEEIFDEAKAQEEVETEPVSKSNARISLGAFIGSYDNLTPEEKEIAQELQKSYRDDPKGAADEISKALEENIDLLDDMSEDKRFDLFELIKAYDEEIDVDRLEKLYEDSLIEETPVEETPIDEAPFDEVADEIDEEADAIDITDAIEDETEVSVKDKPAKEKPKKETTKKGLDRVKVNYSKGEFTVKVDDEVVDDLTDEEIDKLQTGIAAVDEGDPTQLEKASLSILNRVDEVADEPVADEIVDEPPTQEEEEARALDITPKETITQLRKRAKDLGIKNVTKKKEDELLEEIRVLKAVEAKTMAETPEVFEEKTSMMGKLEDLADDLGKEIIKAVPSRKPKKKESLTNFDYGKVLVNFMKDYNDGKLTPKQKEFYEKTILPQIDILEESLSEDVKGIQEGTSEIGIKRKEALEKAEKAFENKEKRKKADEGKPILRSGGAEGADTIFEKFAKAAGHVVKAFSFKGHITKSKNRYKLLPEQLRKADTFLKKANKTLKRKIPKKEDVRNLLRRNYYQVKDSDQIIAVAPLKYGSLTEVEGGTAWAIQMAIDLGKKDIYLYDLSSNKWTKWQETPNGARFLPANAPVLGNNYTGIGSRAITPEGEAAIKSLYGKPAAEEKTVSKFGIESFKKAYSNLSEQHSKFNKIIRDTGQSIFGKIAAWYGAVDYEYSGQKHKMQTMPKEFEAIARDIEKKLGLEEGYFNSALANVYQEGDKLGAHADDEPIFRRENNTIGKVATVSIGGATDITISNNKTGKTEVIRVEDGDLYVMPGQNFQLTHKHAVGKTTGNRISITFRHIPTNVLEMAEAEKRMEDKDRKELEAEVEKTKPENEVEASKVNLEEKTNESEPAFDDEIIEKNPDNNILNDRIDSEDFTYTSGQKNVLTKIVDFLPNILKGKKIDGVNIPFIFAGYAGTGKTTIVENIVNYARRNGYKVDVIAPTNKAVLRLMEKSVMTIGEVERQRYDGNFSTIHSMLYGEPSEETGEWELKLDTYDSSNLVIIDESSMISEELWNDLQEAILSTGAKLILIGDGFQLSPVGGDPHLMARHKKLGIQLTQVVRQAAESSIIKVATALRIKKEIVLPKSSTDDFVILDMNEVKEQFYQDIVNGEDSVMIVSTNKSRVDENRETRNRKYGSKAKDKIIQDDEKIIVINNAQFGRKNGEIFENQGEVYILDPVVVHYNKKVWNYQTNSYEWQTLPVTLYPYQDAKGYFHFFTTDLQEPSLHSQMITEEDKRMLFSEYEPWMTQTKKGKIKFGTSVNVNTYGYVVTAHKSQGSEWDNVYVLEKMNWGKDTVNKVRWFYTAITRAAQKVIIPRKLIDPGQGRSYEELNHIINREGAIENDDTNEKLQEFTQGQRIDNNKELAAKIASRLKKQFPWITTKAVERVYDRFGREVAGKAIDSMVEWSLTKGTLDTIPHEYAHIYIDLLRDSPVVQKGIEKFRGKDDTLEQAEENLVQYIGEYYADRIQVDSIAKKVGIWLKQFWLSIRKAFGNIKKEQIGDYLAEKFYQDSIAKQTVQKTGKERLQEIPENSGTWVQVYNTFENGYKAFKKYSIKQGYRARAVSVEQEHALITHYLEGLYKKDMNSLYEPILEQWLIDRKYPENSETRDIQLEIIMDDSKRYFDDLSEEINQLLTISDRNQDLKIVSKHSFSQVQGLGMFSKTDISYLIFQSKNSDLETFHEVVASMLRMPYESFTDTKKMFSTRFYNSLKNRVSTNNEVGTKAAERQDRTYYEIIIELDGSFSINQKGPVTGNKTNLSHERRRLIENDMNISDIMWIHGEDIKIRKEFDYGLDDKYDSFKWRDLIKLQKALRKQGMMIVLNRGEKERYAIVKLTKENIENGKNAEAYWADKGLTKKQIDNFLGLRFEGIDGVDINLFRAEEIARHEVMERIFPGYLNMPGEKVFKRIKLPLTPGVVSKNMPVAVGHIFNKDKASFVIERDGKEVEVKALYEVSRGNKKYRLDGSSLTSTRLIKAMIKAFGMKPGASKVKTVIQTTNENLDKLFVKHKHFRPPYPVKIYENYGKSNQKLVAEIDEAGYIKDSEGKDIDVLLTDDEAKIFGGEFNVGGKFSIPGTAFGLLNMEDKTHDSAKGVIQLYNYIQNEEILQAWKEEVFPKIRKKLRKVFLLGQATRRKNAQQNIAELFRRISASPNALPDIAHEMFKNDLGMHKQGSGLLDKVVQNQLNLPALGLEGQPGMMGDILVDFTEELDYLEARVSIQDASNIIKAYMEDSDNHNDTRDFKTLQRHGMDAINTWLKTADYKMLITRSPVSHLGGANMVTITKLHDRKGQIHLHPLLVFKDLEGDGDGDKVNLEKLSPKMEELFVSMYEALDVKAVDLKKYQKDKKSYDLSRREDLYRLIEAITWGQKAVPEIANAALYYGILQQTFNYVEIKQPRGNTYQLQLVGLNDKITDERKDGNKVVSGSGITDTFSELLRVYLQAAVDNVEFLLLGDWNYELTDFRSKMFKRSDGKPLTEGDVEVITHLLSELKPAADIRRGRDYKLGSHTLSKSISLSILFKKFTDSKNNTFSGKDFEKLAGVIVRTSFKREGTNFVLHPTEMIATEVARLWEKYSKDKPWWAGSPQILNDNVYFSAHVYAISQMQDKMRDEMTSAKVEKGVDYGKAMGNQFASMWAGMENIDSIGIDGWSTNEKMINFASKFSPQFRKLTNKEKRAAAYAFLEGYDRVVEGQLRQVAEIGTIPPFSKDPKQLSLIDAGVMKEYLDYYHDFLYEEINKGDRDYTTDAGKLKHSEFDLSPINSIITRVKKDIKRNC